MKKLNITWENGIYDPTGYLHSFTKALATSLKASGLMENPEDVVATSGFAFRIWVEGKTLCPSAMSIFDFKLCQSGLENAGYSSDYISRLWDENDLEQVRREEAIRTIVESIDRGIAPVVWDIGIPEWGLVTGYDEDKKVLFYLSVTGEEGEMPFKELGRREIPILSVTVPKVKNNRTEEEILKDTLKIAVSHGKGEEWCENAKGLKAYEALANYFVPENIPGEFSFETEYYLGTYAAWRYYAWQYLKKMSDQNTEIKDIAAGYEVVYKKLKAAFDLRKENKVATSGLLDSIRKHIRDAGEMEGRCIELMEKCQF